MAEEGRANGGRFISSGKEGENELDNGILRTYYTTYTYFTTLKVGDKAPDFISKDQDGNTIKLSDYKGKKLVLFFYPKASTPGCTIEACNLRDNYQTFVSKGYDVLGVSADSEKRQLRVRNPISNFLRSRAGVS